MSLPRRRDRRAVTCRYLSYSLPNGTRLRLPLVHVLIESPTNATSTIALVDSGATSSFIPYAIAEEILQLPPVGDENEAVGAGGTFKTYSVKVDKLSLMKGSKPFVEYKDVELLVPKPPQDLPYVVLGRDGIFHTFDITFRERKEKIVFRPAKR